MPERVIDASVAVKWVMKGESYRRQARKLLRESLAAGIRLVAPPLFENEVESVIQEELFFRHISVADADRALRALDRTRVQIISPGPHAIAPFFEVGFARMEYIGDHQFNLSYMRHTEQWWEIYTELSLDECLAAIREEPHFIP